MYKAYTLGKFFRGNVLQVAVLFTASAAFASAAYAGTCDDVSGAVLGLAIAAGDANAITAQVAPQSLPDKTALGEKDSRGAYQEATIKPIQVTLDYFLPWEQIQLKGNAKDQLKYDNYPDHKERFHFGGRPSTLFFQDGQLKTQNPDSKNYPLLDEGRGYAMLRVQMSFNNKEQLKRGVYTIDGVVTLVTGTASISIQNGSVEQSVSIGYKGSGAYSMGQGNDGQFNNFGNGRNDRGRIDYVGLTSRSPERMTIGDLRAAMGDKVDVVYP